MAPRITYEQSSEQIRELWDRVDAAREARGGEAELDGYRELLDHPCAHHQVVDHEVLDEIHQVLRRLDRYDEAIQAKREAIDAGYRSTPDPEADIAECLVEAGLRAEADALFSELRRRDPDEVWLYNSAGWAYSRVDDQKALRWLLDGIQVALVTGDPDQVIGQLLDMTRDCWDRVGAAEDAEMIARVEVFQRDWVRPRYRSRSSGKPSRLDESKQRCVHCGFDPDSHPSPAQTAAKSRGVEAPTKIALSLAWFPADEWQLAMERWPDLLDELPVDHAEYSRRIEARLKWMSNLTPGQALTVSPLSVNELDETEGENAGSGEGRSRLAAEIALTGRALRWPPSRNDACWCGSGRNYEKCYGPTPPAED